jgi:hypothetical protein
MQPADMNKNAVISKKLKGNLRSFPFLMVMSSGACIAAAAGK